MEMILHAVKFCLADVLIEQRYGLCLQEALLLLLIRLIGVQLEKEGVSLLVEFQRFLGVNLLVVEFESVIFEIGGNLHLSFEIDRSLLGTKSLALRGIIKVEGVGVLWGLVQALKKANTWSLSSWVLDPLRIIVLEGMPMLVLTVWSTEQWFWNSMRVCNEFVNLSFYGLLHELLLFESHLSPAWDD